MSYMNLSASDIREVMPPASRGADDALLQQFLDEYQQWLDRELGGLPDSDIVLRGILRDLTAARAARKIATNPQELGMAESLYKDAMGRLETYSSAASSHDYGSPAVFFAEAPW